MRGESSLWTSCLSGLASIYPGVHACPHAIPFLWPDVIWGMHVKKTTDMCKFSGCCEEPCRLNLVGVPLTGRRNKKKGQRDTSPRFQTERPAYVYAGELHTASTVGAQRPFATICSSRARHVATYMLLTRCGGARHLRSSSDLTSCTYMCRTTISYVCRNETATGFSGLSGQRTCV